jgi:hypothetical protein
MQGTGLSRKAAYLEYVKGRVKAALALALLVLLEALLPVTIVDLSLFGVTQDFISWLECCKNVSTLPKAKLHTKGQSLTLGDFYKLSLGIWIVFCLVRM